MIGRIDIGSRCFIGTHSSIGINTRMGDDCRLGDNSMLPDGAVMAAGESRRGSPAEPAEVELPEIDERRPRTAIHFCPGCSTSSPARSSAT